MTTRPNPQQTPDDWHPARGGEVVRLARRLKGQRTRRQFLKAGAGIVGGLLATIGGLWGVRSATREREYDFGGLTCSEVAARSDDYWHGRLPAADAAKVNQHVALCPNCKPTFEHMSGMNRVGRAGPIGRPPDVG